MIEHNSVQVDPIYIRVIKTKYIEEECLTLITFDWINLVGHDAICIKENYIRTAEFSIECHLMLPLSYSSTCRHNI